MNKWGKVLEKKIRNDTLQALLKIDPHYSISIIQKQIPTTIAFKITRQIEIDLSKDLLLDNKGWIKGLVEVLLKKSSNLTYLWTKHFKSSKEIQAF